MKASLDSRAKATRRAVLTAAVGSLLVGAGALLFGRDAELVWLREAQAGFFPGGSAGLRFLDRVYPTLQLAFCLWGGGWAWLLGRSAEVRSAGLRFVCVPLATSLLTSALKSAWERPRPQHPDSGLGLDPVGLITHLADRESFPSGHASVCASVAALLLILWAGRRRWVWIVAALPALMSWSRVALAVHWPSDVVVGTGLGLLVAASATLLLGARDPALPAAWPRGAVVLAALLIITASWPDRSSIVDPGSGAELNFIQLEPRPLRIVFEPWVGWPLEWAYASDPKSFILSSLPWAVLGVTLLALFPRRLRPGARLRRVAVLAAGLALMGFLALRGSLPADRWVASKPGVFVDLHVHGSDPVDGAMDAMTIRARSRARGIASLSWTNHDAPPPLPLDIPGLEWSAFVHPRAVVPHLLVLGGDGAIAEALAVPPLEIPDGGGPDLAAFRRSAAEMIAAAKRAGGVVIVAHDWRTFVSLRERGSELPTPEEWADMGVDGFEVGNRRPEPPGPGAARLAAIEATARKRGLLRISTSDDHGIPAGSPCISFIHGRFSEDRALRVLEVLAALKEPSRVQPVVAQRGRGEATLALQAPLALWRYFAALGVPSRLSWLGWAGLFALLARARRRDQ